MNMNWKFISDTEQFTKLIEESLLKDKFMKQRCIRYVEIKVVSNKKYKYQGVKN